MPDLKTNIQQALANFLTQEFTASSIAFWKTLGYESERRYEKMSYTFDEFRENFSYRHKLRAEKVLKEDWSAINILFQLTDAEIKANLADDFQIVLPGFEDNDVNGSNVKSYLFASVELNRKDYTRTQIATMSREINRCFAMPVLLLIKNGSKLTLSVIYRRRNKKDADKDVLEKVTQIKDINIGGNTHRAHIEILFDLSLSQLARKQPITNFDTLHRAWENTLSTDALSNTFYRELRNWFLWTINSISFPQIVPPEDEIPDAEHQKISAIRLLTRFMFCWFLKEKQELVPSALFDSGKLGKILKDFNPTGEESNYYQAIMQNLFFATLSVPMRDRRFINESSFHGNNKDYANPRVFRYHEQFQDPSHLKDLFASIPFLNGGLFDCMDKGKGIDSDIEIRIDGFSNNEKKRAKVPNKLFWGEAVVNLSQELGSAKYKSTKVHGLIQIFGKYKFTVEENTPIDEEIALDPTLLGRAFEELLAYYNPETNEAAKNQTGSFYTPPLISEYMIDRSLRTYLENTLRKNTKMSKADIEIGLDILLSYTEREHAFTLEETKILVRALDECKAIDPACGSGAFLMGILHKMVYILQKLDNDNKLWFERLIENFPSHLKDEMRTKLSDENHAYNRKLGLIQKCVYGVDIQPIAIQIAKLRFFLTLLIEQDIDLANTSANYNILPLPNLDFKLVCADTILRLNTDMVQSDQDQILMDIANPYATELKETVSDYFSSSKPLEKQQIADKIKGITYSVADTQISEIDKKLKHILYESDARKKQKLQNEIDKITFEKDQWLSYHGIFDNRTVLFFETQFQFPDVEEGFDIVIGNPPYIRLQSAMIKEQTLHYQRMGYRSFERTGDIYCLFYERGLDILKDGGILCYITSNKWMRSGYGQKLRELLQSSSTIRELVDMRGYKVFSSAAVDTNIITLQKNPPQDKHLVNFVNIGEDFSGSHLAEYLQEHPSTINQISLRSSGWTLADNATLAIKEKMERIGKPLKDWDVSIYYGIKTGCNKAFIIDTATKEELCRQDSKSAEIIKPILRGRDIGRYSYKWADLWLLFVPWHFPLNHDPTIQGASSEAEIAFQKEFPAVYKHLLGYKDVLSKRNQAETGIRYEWYALQRCAASYNHEFDNPKIIYPVISTTSSFYYDTKGYMVNDKVFIITGENIKYVLAALNSNLMFWYFTKINSQLGKEGMEFRKIYVENAPVLEINKYLDYSFKDFEVIIDEINLLGLSRNLEDSPEIIKRFDTLSFELDRMIYRLYNLSEEEIGIIERDLGK